MFQKTRRFLVISFTCLAILCIVVFLWVGTAIGQKSEDAVSEIGEIYMSEMSRQLQQKFTAIIDSRFSQVEGVIQRVKPNVSRNIDKMYNELAISARICEFTYLGLYTEDGEDETVYGESVTIYDRDVFLQDLIQGKNKVTSGENKSGERILLMGANASYKMKSGKVSKTLVVGIPMSYLKAALALEDKNPLVYSHIIREDGNYVIRTVEAFRNSYFERLKKICENDKGKTPEQYVAELKEAMAAKKEYSTMVTVDGEHRHIYSAHLPNSDWYLISVMPYSKLDDAISNLGDQRLYTMMGACIAILIAFIAIFVLYYRMSQQQMREMEEARKAAQRANRAKSEFLSNMSHDIRTQMNGIVGMTAIARTNIDDKVRVEDCLKKITMSSRHLLGLINDVLDMSKIENGKLSLNMDQISLRETMDSIVNIEEEPKQEDDEPEYFVGRRILLAEDNDLNWEIAEDILTNAGFELERAENGQVCVDKFNESEVGYYDVVLMDIRMPVMDGYGAAENIRALERPDAGLPIIAMTADAFSEDIKHCLDCGMNAHIAKPIDVKKLIQQLHQYLKL